MNLKKLFSFPHELTGPMKPCVLSQNDFAGSGVFSNSAALSAAGGTEHSSHSHWAWDWSGTIYRLSQTQVPEYPIQHYWV